MMERARNMNIYVEFNSLDDIGDIIAQIKSQDVWIYEVELDRGHKERGQNPSAVFSVRLKHRELHTRVLAAISELETVHRIDEI